MLFEPRSRSVLCNCAASCRSFLCISQRNCKAGSSDAAFSFWAIPTELDGDSQCASSLPPRSRTCVFSSGRPLVFALVVVLWRQVRSRPLLPSGESEIEINLFLKSVRCTSVCVCVCVCKTAAALFLEKKMCGSKFESLRLISLQNPFF